MTLASAGEFALIERLRPLLGATRADLVVGVGVDAALLDP